MTRKTLSYRYAAAGNRRGLTDADGGRFTYAYDSVRRIAHLENPQNERTTYAYGASGRRTLKQLANGSRASFTYDDAGNLTRLANLKSDGTTISRFDYTYDKTSNRTAVLEADGSRVTWSYDNAYQLTGEHRTGSNAYRNTFTYDAAGNRTLKNESGQPTIYAYDAANQLQTAEDAAGVTTYTFDADGNQQQVQTPNGDRTTTVWDYENRTSVMQLPSGVRNTMAYHPDGLRIKLEDSIGTRNFVWDDQNYLAETDANNDTQAVYTNEPAFYGQLISQRRGSTTHWYHFDALGSTRELSDNSEAVTDTYLYDAWGVPIATNGNTINAFRYVGELGYYFDTDTGNNYVRARIYQPAIARWTSLDRLRFELGQPWYSYAMNAVLTQLDPSGLACAKCSGFDHVPNRGVFTSIFLGPYDRGDDSPLARRVGSQMLLRWDPSRNPNPFLDGSCCCCLSVVAVQIVKQVSPQPSAWELDGGIPYPFSSEGNPCSTAVNKPTGVTLQDKPNIPNRPWVNHFEQEFETCIMCTAGPEGPSFSFAKPPGYAVSPTLGCVYGCIRWYEFTARMKD